MPPAPSEQRTFGRRAFTVIELMIATVAGIIVAAIVVTYQRAFADGMIAISWQSLTQVQASQALHDVLKDVRLGRVGQQPTLKNAGCASADPAATWSLCVPTQNGQVVYDHYVSPHARAGQLRRRDLDPGGTPLSDVSVATSITAANCDLGTLPLVSCTFAATQMTANSIPYSFTLTSRARLRNP